MARLIVTHYDYHVKRGSVKGILTLGALLEGNNPYSPSPLFGLCTQQDALLNFCRRQSSRPWETVNFSWPLSEPLTWESWQGRDEMPSFYPLLRVYCFKEPLRLTAHVTQRSTVQKSRVGDNAETDAPVQEHWGARMIRKQSGASDRKTGRLWCISSDPQYLKLTAEIPLFSYLEVEVLKRIWQGLRALEDSAYNSMNQNTHKQIVKALLLLPSGLRLECTS